MTRVVPPADWKSFLASWFVPPLVIPVAVVVALLVVVATS